MFPPVSVHIDNSMWPYGYQKGGFYGVELRNDEGVGRYCWMFVDSFAGNQTTKGGIPSFFNGMSPSAVVRNLH